MSSKRYIHGWPGKAIQFYIKKYLFRIFFAFMIVAMIVAMIAFIALIFIPYSKISQFCPALQIRESLGCFFQISGNEVNYQQLIAVGTLINTILTNSYDNMLKSKSQRIHGFLYADLHRWLHRVAHALRFYSVLLVFITMLLYIQGKTLRMLVVWCVTAIVTCVLLLLSFFAVQTSESSVYKELDRRLKSDFMSQTGSSWKLAMMRSMEFTLVRPDYCALTERNDLEFFSVCLINAWKHVLHDDEDQVRLLAMEYEILRNSVDINTRIQKTDPCLSYFIPLLNCADGLKDKDKSAGKNDYLEAYGFYLYSIFLYVFIYLAEEKRWTTLAQVVNHAPTMPRMDKKIVEQYIRLKMLAILACITEGYISEAFFEHIDYPVLRTVRYSRGTDLAVIWRFITAESPISAARGENLYEIGWVIYRQFCWKGDV